MSFGSFSSRRATASDAPCPCGSGASFAGCCGALLAGEPAPDAERLMRSRYTAFVEGDAAHLERTWHPRTRPATIEIDPDLVWEGLTVDEASTDGDTATVAFRARWRDGSRRGVLVERSTFARRAGRWFYVQGDVSDERREV